MATSAKVDRELAAVQLAKTDKEALAESTVKAVEGQVVGKKEYDYVDLGDEKFRVREKVGAMALFKWSAAAEMGTEDPRALGAIYAMLKAIVHKEDWAKFEEHALDNDADAEELLDVVTSGLEIVAGRPTKQS